jgi:hypothetical protein
MVFCVLYSARTCFSISYSSFDDDKTFGSWSIKLLTSWLRPRLCRLLRTEKGRALSGLDGSEATGQLVHVGLELYICLGLSELDWAMTVVYQPLGLVPRSLTHLWLGNIVFPQKTFFKTLYGFKRFSGII